ncbi:MAG: ATP-binding cassette domain-containing protein [Pirellulaceae bacterium]|jgi:putative ABC transport system ATP-binding protein
MVMGDIPTGPVAHRATKPRAELGESSTVTIRQLQHFFGEAELRKQVLFDIDLEIFGGEILIMTGPSGSGKTTLLTLIGALRQVQEGQLWVMGSGLHQFSDPQRVALRQKIGFIFQSHNLFESLTALQNVRMALELVEPQMTGSARSARAKEMLQAVGLADRANHLPRQLSGGQKQRVAIARGLVHRPPLVLADEPTAALDEKSGRLIVELLRRQAKESGATILMVTHDNRILDVADRMINLVDGRIRSDVLVQESTRIARLLAQCSVFEGVTPRTLANVADQVQVQTVAEGEKIIEEGATGDRFYLIRDGAVRVLQGNPPMMVAILGPGDFFGDRALLTGQPRNATVVAEQTTTLYCLSKQDFQKAMNERATLEAEVRSSLFDR